MFTPTATAIATPLPLPPEEWRKYPLLPSEISEAAKEIYLRGIAMGNNPHAFSIIGDCQSEPKVFLGTYDTDRFQLPTEFQYLEETIANFTGSFSRMGAAVIDGASAATELSNIWSDIRICNRNETPVECELRVHRPVIVFINLGTHWTDRDPKYLRRIVDIVIANGAVPIISTKADNREGGHIANEELTRIAYEYKLPLWNFWSSVQDLPNGGINPYRQGGNIYLTTEGRDRHRFTALLALNAVWRGLND